jgi:phosphoglycolate phosphatase-like HAD superfamily hydrolase
MDKPMIYALDFDGVICDSADETGITGWKAARKIWLDMPNAIPSEFIHRFRQIRPIIETGYEAVLTMRMLYQGETTEAICHNFADRLAFLMLRTGISIDDLKILFDSIRDDWIAKDEDGWVAMNPLFDGVTEKLKQLNENWQSTPWYIITTKQERFVKQILKANAIDVADEHIYGLSRNMNKVPVLTELLKIHPDETIYFIEDRYNTLINVANSIQSDRIKLVFALWGYNMAEEKVLAHENNFTVQQLENFLE